MLTLVSCNDYGPTGQGIQLRLPKETLKKVVEEPKETQSDIKLPKDVIMKVVEEAKEQSENKGYCDCPDPYMGKIITKDWSHGMLTSLSEYDCLVTRYIAELRQDLKLPPGQDEGLIIICDKLGWGK